MSRSIAVTCALVLASLVCAGIFEETIATPVLSHRENIPLNAEVFAQPEYVEALAKELENEETLNVPVWWLRQQQRQQSGPTYRPSGGQYGNLDQIGGGNLLRRNLDSIGGGNLVRRNLDSIGGGNLLRSLEANNRPPTRPSSSGTLDSIGGGVAALKNQEDSEHLTRNTRNDFDDGAYGHKKFVGHRKSESSNSPSRHYSDRVIFPSELLELSAGKRNFDEIDRNGFSGFSGKRNFDEIDRNGFSGFSGKRNFDEIDRNGFSGFSKRNFDEIDRNGFSGFNKRNFDEIDRNGFSGFSKRNFDEIDRNGFSGFSKKRNFDEIDRNGFSGFSKKRNFDEIDRNGFSGFSKRNFDEIDRSGVPGFTKRSIPAASRSKLASRRRR